jgi:site-specific DNA recombinase
LAKTAILYARVSTLRQAEEGYGLDYQLRELRNWAKAEGYSIVEEIKEPGYSRESWKRPGLDRIRDLAEEGFRGDILAWQRDRYFTDPVYRGLFDKEMGVYGIRLRAMDDAGGGDPEEADAEIFNILKDVMGRRERRKTTKRTRAGKREAAYNGRYVWNGIPPYGYIYEDGELKPDPSTAPNVRRIFKIVGDEGRGKNQVRKAFQDAGIPTPRGGKVWHVSTISRILNNDVYLSRPYDEVAGLVSADVAAHLDSGKQYALTYYNKRRSKTIHSMNGTTRNISFNDPDTWIPVPVPDLNIPPEWVHAARRNTQNRTRWQSNDKREWPLRGLAFCPCGRQLVAF